MYWIINLYSPVFLDIFKASSIFLKTKVNFLHNDVDTARKRSRFGDPKI